MKLPWIWFSLFPALAIIASCGVTNELSVVDLPKVQALTNPEDDTLYIINFWATWCGPCRKEMPYFEKVNRNYADQGVKVIFVSLDHAKFVENVQKFIQRNHIRSKVYLLDEKNPNEYINKINPSWEGTIPATYIIYRKGNYMKFFERPLDHKELKTIIEQLKPQS